jgi:hypothetical protein
MPRLLPDLSSSEQNDYSLEKVELQEKDEYTSSF